MESNKACPCEPLDKPILRQFLKDYGDNLPDEVIEQALQDLNTWVTRCDCADPSKLLGVGHYERNDWYLCTLKAVAVDAKERQKGYGKETVGKLTELAASDPHCKVLAADITCTNIPSIKSFKRAGFSQVGRFCWQKGEEPADIVHLILYPPVDEKCP